MKKKYLLSSCVLLIFAILAGGSLDGDEFKTWLWVIVTVVVCIIAAAIIQSAVQSKNKKKRLEMIQQDEASDKDFDRSVNFGNDHCKFYFDSSKKQVMIMRVMTEGINKVFVDEFEFGGKDLCCQHDPYFCIYDCKNRKLLTGSYEEAEPTYTITNIAEEDKHKNVVPKSTITPKIVSSSVTVNTVTFLKELVYTLIDESYGLMVIIRKGKVSSIFNYINETSLPQKTGNKSYVNYQGIGNYNFIMDDFFNVLVIVTPSSYELYNYSDIIEVSYEENGSQIYSKSAMRTVGGAIVGGALMGGAGAVVGGLSGASRGNKEIKTMKIKILLRNTQRTSLILDFNDSQRVLKTKEPDDNTKYESYLKNADRAKDVLSVVIDKAKQPRTSTPQTVVKTPSHQSRVADELAKLAKLKADGILTEEEFAAQKAKLLNL
jgi:hypothetical protein